MNRKQQDRQRQDDFAFPQGWTLFSPVGQDAPEPDFAGMTAIPKELAIAGKKLAAQPAAFTGGRLDLGALCGGKAEGKTAYLLAVVEVDKDTEIELGAGADWWMKWWMNGAVVCDTLKNGNGNHPPSVTDYRFTARLKAGRNLVAVKVVSGGGSFVLAAAGGAELRAELRRAEIRRQEAEATLDTWRAKDAARRTASRAEVDAHGEALRQATAGERYQATVPDTLDLAERAALGVNGLTGSIDPEMLTMYGLIGLCAPRPFLRHWASADVTCDTKFGEALAMLRAMCGSDQNLELESRYRTELCSRVDDGLYWDRCTPLRPWRSSYGNNSERARDEDFCVVGAAGRMVRALLVWRQLEDRPQANEELARTLVHGMRRILVCKDDYGYYPVNGGWGEDCTYPRSGWIDRDEAQDDTEGREGGVTAYHGHQIYGAARFYAVSGDPVALDLAARLSRYVMKPRFWGGVPEPDATVWDGHAHGTARPRRSDPPHTAGHELGHWFSHWHARAIPLRGLLEYGIAAGDARVIEFVRRSYEFTLTRGIPRLGWVNTSVRPNGSLMEACALGDFVGLGIRLSDSGAGDYWDDVDACVRNHLAEMQLTDMDAVRRVSEQFKDGGFMPSWLQPFPENQGWGNCFDNFWERTRGLFLSCGAPTSVPGPWLMHCCNGNAMQGLYYAWEGIVREKGDKAVVNLLLNRAARLVDVDSYLPYEGKVAIRVKTARRVAVRIPHWVDVRELRATVNGKPADLDWTGRYLEFGGLAARDTIELTFPVKESAGTYTVAAHTPWETTYSCTFRGSTLVGISPRDTAPTSVPLYRRDHMRADAAPLKEVTRFVPRRIVANW